MKYEIAKEGKIEIRVWRKFDRATPCRDTHRAFRDYFAALWSCTDGETKRKMSEDLTQRRTRVFSPSIPRHKSARHAGGRFHRGGHVSKQRKERKETKEERTDRERERRKTCSHFNFASVRRRVENVPQFRASHRQGKARNGRGTKGSQGGRGRGEGEGGWKRRSSSRE